MRTAVNVIVSLMIGLAKLELILNNRCYCMLIYTIDNRLSQVNQLNAEMWTADLYEHRRGSISDHFLYSINYVKIKKKNTEKPQK